MFLFIKTKFSRENYLLQARTLVRRAISNEMETIMNIYEIDYSVRVKPEIRV